MRDMNSECPSCGGDLPECDCSAGPVIFELRARLAEAMEVIRPFAVAGSEYPDADGDSVQVEYVKNFRRAAAFVAENGGAGG